MTPHPITLTTFQVLDPEECLRAGSEIEKFRQHVAPHCVSPEGWPLPTLEIASGGAVSVPWAISFDLPPAQYDYYNSSHAPRGPLHVRGDALKLPFETNSFMAVAAHHLLEDFPQSRWDEILREWTRVVRHGGKLIISVPDHDLWWDYVKRGGCHNHAHAQPQPKLGDLSRAAETIGLRVVEEKMTRCYEGDFTILGVFLKP